MIGHDDLRESANRGVLYVISAGAHKVKDYRCEFTGFTVRIGKICTYITPRYANCGRKH